MLNLLLSFSTDAKHFLFWKWPGSGKTQNWILNSVPEYLWFPLWLIICGDKVLLFTFNLVWTLLLFVPGQCKGQLLAVPPPKLVAAARRNVRVSNCTCADESLAVFLLSAEKVRNSVASLPGESLATIPLAAVILSAKCVVAFATCTGNHPAYSSVKWEVLPFFCRKVSWMQSAGRSQVQVASVYGKGSFESRSQVAPLQASTGWNFHESPWLMIPIPASLVCPKTCDTVAEDAFNIASSLSIGRTHDERGIFRQSWRRHVREPPSLFKCEVRSPSRARPRAGCKYIWERLVWKQITSCTFTSKYWVELSWITLAYDSYPSIIGLSQDMWHCGRRCF